MRSALSDLEHQVMQAVWASGPCTVETVHQAVSRQRDLKEVTVRTVLRRLEQKGHLQHEVEGRAYIYRAVEAPRSLAARAVRHILDRFCHGSVDELVSGLVESNVLTDAELEALEASIKARKRARAATSAKKGR
jgi:BlaI family transcriptional regulator, penicillinase repressor